jgi:TPR repeat protein
MAYVRGIVVAHDKQKGIEWLRKAAAQGDEDAEVALRIVGFINIAK